MKRGLFVLFEGKDRVGKTTQARLLVDALRAEGRDAELLRFPARHTEIGKILNAYLRGECAMIDARAMHLLFAANRLEFESEIREKLEKGTMLVVDRYVFSGIAYSAAKGLDVNWCERIEASAPVPDLMFLLHCGQEVASHRAGFGEEVNENEEFQIKIEAAMRSLDASKYADEVNVIDVTDASVESIFEHIMIRVKSRMDYESIPHFLSNSSVDAKTCLEN
jgi:dTMP kinase